MILGWGRRCWCRGVKRVGLGIERDGERTDGEEEGRKKDRRVVRAELGMAEHWKASHRIALQAYVFIGDERTTSNDQKNGRRPGMGCEGKGNGKGKGKASTTRAMPVCLWVYL